MSKFSFLQYSFLVFAGMAGAAFGMSFFVSRAAKNHARAFVLSFFVTVLFVIDAFLIEPNWIQVTRLEIRDPKLAVSLEGVKIVHITDLHLTHGIGFREKRLIEKVNELKPDLIFITGDFFDDIDQVEPTKELIQSLSARIGIWGVPGNTDHISMHASEVVRALEPSGIRILVNQGQSVYTGVGKYFWLVGVDEPVYHHDKLGEALYGVPKNEPRLLLAHSPDIMDKASLEGINLVLAGHTHGGQVGIPFLVELSKYANRALYMKGLFKKGGTQLYVNRGIGMKTLPIRFLCRPEIAVIEIGK
ncbi:MAG: metallophosphoesterase [Candidatus Omnitrophica bacterium]|nr:metallophosphoesterase [Candidatus Omnitrophota bacterium]